MTSRVLVVALAISAFMPQAALAREYYYFNKADVSREDFVRDRTDCLKLAEDVKTPASSAYVPYNNSLSAGQNAAAAGLAGLFAGLMLGSEERRVGLAVERTCMADKGYTRFVVDKNIIEDIAELKDENAQVEKYFEFATRNDPIGKGIRE